MLRRDDTDRPVVPPVGDPARWGVPARDRLRFLEDPPPEVDEVCDCPGCVDEGGEG